MYNFKLKNKPNFLNNDILKNIIDIIHENKNIKDISSIRFYLKEDLIDKLIYQLAVDCNEKITHIGNVELYLGSDVVVFNIAFRKNENYKPCLCLY